MGATHHLVLNVRFRESKSTVKVKSVLEPMGAFSIYFCIKVMSGHCFWRREKADMLLCYAESEVVLRGR